MLIYSAGLRGQEAINLKLSDIDYERKTIHIRQSKYKKDRIAPLNVLYFIVPGCMVNAAKLRLYPLWC
ncbi:MAG TPA: tyrosine-type recombinase/integrase [Bacteroidales bacterium]|nr:tyrosine-type recombinase/integrase [Bacteroidales bacterium]